MLSVVSCQTLLQLEHGDLHTSNLMINPARGTRLCVKTRRHTYDVTSECDVFVRIIDWGFAKSDLVFGEGDVRTCLAIESEKRLSLTHNLLYPCEFFDVACCLYELQDKIRQLSRADAISSWLHTVIDSVNESVCSLMRWESMEKGKLAIETTGMYPLQFSQMGGRALLGWFEEVFGDLSTAESGVTCTLPTRAQLVGIAQPGTSFARVLGSIGSSRPV